MRLLRAIGQRQLSRSTTSDRTFLAASALLFVASAAASIVWCGSMATTSGMPTHAGCAPDAHGAGAAGAHSMSGTGWAPGSAAASFLAMWVVMMAAMMLPALVPMLWRYRHAVVPTSQLRLGGLTAVAGGGYFFVWTAIGTAAFPLGIALAALEIRMPALAHAAPIAAGLALVIAGAVQLTAWKARYLACCRVAWRGPGLSADAGTAWRHGLRLGLHCSRSCGNLMAILLAFGAMDLRAMAAVTAAITAERLAPAGERAARATGYVVIGAGLYLLAQAAGLAGG